MVRKPAPKIFVSNELAQRLEKLRPEHKIARWINEMKRVLSENMYAGDLIRKSQIPKQYIENYNVNNLYRYVTLKDSACYTILNGYPYILDIMSHPEYDKVFGYKTT
jgi:hypothetical protein